MSEVLEMRYFVNPVDGSPDLPYVLATVNDTKIGSFIFDTGCSKTVFTQKAVEKWGLQLTGNRQASTPINTGSGYILGEEIQIESFLLGQTVWRDRKFLVANIETPYLEVAGLIGQDLMKEFGSIRIDNVPMEIELKKAGE